MPRLAKAELKFGGRDKSRPHTRKTIVGNTTAGRN